MMFPERRKLFLFIFALGLLELFLFIFALGLLELFFIYLFPGIIGTPCCRPRIIETPSYSSNIVLSFGYQPYSQNRLVEDVVAAMRYGIKELKFEI